MAVAHIEIEGSTSHAVPRLEDHEGLAASQLQIPGGSQSCQSSAYDGDVQNIVRLASGCTGMCQTHVQAEAAYGDGGSGEFQKLSTF
ncbi:hypothetical protein EMIT0P4_140053 [Pseudomonas sp. IT-P4]